LARLPRLRLAHCRASSPGPLPRHSAGIERRRVMEGIIFLVIILAAAHAIDSGREYAWNRAKTAAKSRWQAYTAKKPAVGRGSNGEHATHPAPEGNNEMTIDTATGGDVQTMEQLIAELETIGKEAAAELEDAQADAQRAREDAARVDTMVASLAQLDLDQDSL